MKPKIYSILPKILHINKKFQSYQHISGSNFLPATFCPDKMDYYLRKVLKHNRIKYTYNRKLRRLTINEPDSPFRVYMEFDEFGVTIHQIPDQGLSWFFQSSYPSVIIEKMVEKGIIRKPVPVPMYLESLIRSNNEVEV